MSGDTEAEHESGSSPTGEEDKAEQLTRNLNELLQELRVMQTGAQILTGFLLTVPFSNGFSHLDTPEKYVYLAVLCGSVFATGLIMAPVAFHRTLFRQGQREWIVEAANRAAQQSLVALALTMSGVVWLVFDVVVGAPASHIAGAVTMVLFAVVWGVLPVASRRRFDAA